MKYDHPDPDIIRKEVDRFRRSILREFPNPWLISEGTVKIALNTKADKQISIKAKTRRKVKVKQHGGADLEINPGKPKKAKPKKKPKG